jgi:glycosyltransferase involved in cell wall biosynthesis
MRIAITSQNLDPKIVVSGISTVTTTIINYSGNDFFFYEMGYRDNEKKRNINWFLKQIFFFIKFPYFLLKNKIVLVHLNVPFDAMGITREYMALILAKLLRKKVLVHIHGGKYLMIPTENRVLRFLITRILNDGDRVLVLSDIEKKTLEKNYHFGKAAVLENAVDTSVFKYNFSGTNKSKLQVLYLARITESKGINDIIDAFKLLYPQLPFKFVVCGNGPDRDFFVKSCKNIMGDDFEYKGVVAGRNKLEVIAESDLFILPSRHSEGLPMSLLETMSSGLVPVVTDESSMKYIVKPDLNGVKVEKYNGVDIYKKMMVLMQNRDQMLKYSESARKTVEDHYDTKNYVKKLDFYYSEVIKRGKE